MVIIVMPHMAKVIADIPLDVMTHTVIVKTSLAGIAIAYVPMFMGLEATLVLFNNIQYSGLEFDYTHFTLNVLGMHQIKSQEQLWLAVSL